MHLHRSLPILGMLPLFLFWVSLLGCNWLLLRRQFLNIADGILVSVFLSWTAIILAAHGLGLLGLLNHGVLFWISSLAITASGASLLRWSSTPRQVTEEKMPGIATVPFARCFAWVFGAAFGFLLLCNLLIALTYEPNNYDSVAYRLSRVIFYVSNGSMSQFTTGVDPRMIFYPLNGVILNSPVAIFHLPVEGFTLMSTGAWTVLAILMVQFCRELGFGLHTAVITAGLLITCPTVLAQATSTNDEILGAVPLVAAVRFFALFSRNKSPFDAYLGGCCLGCSMGTKLHWSFYWPMGLAILFIWYYNYGFKLEDFRRFFLRSRQAIIPLVLAAILTCPFIFYNLKGSGTGYAFSLTSQAVNKPFSARAALTNLELQSLQMLVNPFVDLYLSKHVDKRHAWVDRVNRISIKVIPKIVDLKVHFYNFEPFHGIENDLGYDPFEQSVWLGFIPYVFLGTLIASFLSRGLNSFILQALGVSALIWWLIFCCTSMFYYTVGVYVIYPAIVASPVLAFLTVYRVNRHSAVKYLQALLLLALTVTNFIFDGGLLSYNLLRPMRTAVKHPFTEIRPEVDPGVSARMATAHTIYIPDMHWETPFLTLMSRNVSARYFTSGGTLDRLDSDLTLLAVQADPQFGWVIFESPQGKANFLGASASGYGKDAVFELLRQPDSQRRFILLRYDGKISPDHIWIFNPNASYGDSIVRSYNTILRSGDGTVIGQTREPAGGCSIDLSKLKDKMIRVDLIDQATLQLIGHARFDPTSASSQIDFARGPTVAP